MTQGLVVYRSSFVKMLTFLASVPSLRGCCFCL